MLRKNISLYIYPRGTYTPLEILASYMKTPIGQKDILKTLWGRPYLKNCATTFNISHKKEIEGVAIADRGSVGLDIESKNTIIKCHKKILHPIESEYFYDLDYSQQQERIIKIFSIKESILKAIGIGISYNLKEIYFSDSKVFINDIYMPFVYFKSFEIGNYIISVSFITKDIEQPTGLVKIC